MLNAKQHEREAEIITQAGQLAAVTVATNMAGRGVDILLGGNPEGLARRGAAEGLGLDTGGVTARSTRSCSRGSREECKAEGDKVRALGGLYVLGTERHESRRIDNQLRGRSGRQGDPGESRFYLSLEDELMRLFATGADERVMGKAFPDDVPLESKMVTKAVERAQRTVEDRNFEIRKNVLKYDEVMNEQRKVIYKRRQQILDGEDLRDAALEAIERGDRPRRSTRTAPVTSRRSGTSKSSHRQIQVYLPDARSRIEQLDDDRRARGARTTLLIDDALALYEEKEAAHRRRHAARHRAPGDALGARPALARAPLRDGLPPGGHQPARHGPAATRSPSGSARASTCSKR